MFLQRILILVAWYGTLCIPQAGFSQEEETNVLSYLYDARNFYKTVKDYRCVFLKQERLEGKLRNPETILFKFQKPFKIYMKWIKDPNKDREVLFVPGKYDNKLKIHIGGLISIILPCLTLSPDSPLVKKNARHPITNAGMGNLIASLIDQFELAHQQGDLHIIFHPDEQVQGVNCMKIERILPKDKGYYCHRLILYLNKENHVPAKVMVYDWNDVLIEDYTFATVEWNVGLSDADFDSKNREYHFGIF